ncbi:MAG: hypothetical protein LBG70_02625 [Bifidobacteriaceae bacterium]|nr:hypothetical protein [Bifidobacteriaceae bacterium]
MTGCTDKEPSVDVSPWAQEFRDTLAIAKSDYVKAILADGVITEAELKDAQQHVIACLADGGVTARYVTGENGDTGLETADLSEAQWEVNINCHNQWMGQIDALYYQIARNPYNEDFQALAAACLVRKGLAPKGFTASDYENFSRNNGTEFNMATITANPGHMVTVEPNPDAVATLPGGARGDDPAVIKCETNPRDDLP